MSPAFPLPPDAQARMNMLFAGLSESRRDGISGGNWELPPTGDRQTIVDNYGAGCDGHHGGDLATVAALVEAEMVLTQLRQTEDR